MKGRHSELKIAKHQNLCNHQNNNRYTKKSLFYAIAY